MQILRRGVPQQKKPEAYWQFQFKPNPSQYSSSHEAKQELLNKLNQSVKKRMVDLRLIWN